MRVSEMKFSSIEKTIKQLEKNKVVRKKTIKL